MAGTVEGAAKARAARSPRVQSEESVTKIVYRVINRPLNMGDHELQVGEIVPDADTWPRVEAWVRARRIKEERA